MLILLKNKVQKVYKRKMLVEVNKNYTLKKYQILNLHLNKIKID